MKNPVCHLCCIFSLLSGRAPRLAFILWLCFIFHPEGLRAQAKAGPDLQQFAGIYQLLGNQNLSLEISPAGNQLQIIESWSKNKIRFDRKGELNFAGADNADFTLDFTRDKSGAIVQVTAFKQDVWLKARALTAKPGPAQAARQAQIYKNIFPAFEAAVNANSPDKIEKFIQAYVDPAVVAAATKPGLIRQVQNVYRSTGGIDRDNQRPFSPETGSALYKGRSLGNLSRVSFSLSPEGKINNYSFQDLQDYAPPKKPVNEAILRETLERALNDLARKDLFSGTVLVARGDQVLFRFAAGDADKKNHVKNTLQTRFNLGSMNKMFTATAIMQLAEKGKLGLQDPIGKYLDTTWLPRSVSEQVTIRHLISHTSGIGDAFWDFFKDTPRVRFRQLEGYKPFTRNLALAGKPGTTWSYNNTGMLLAGAIVQQVSGMDYFEYVRQHIYRPAGMQHTDVFEVNDKPGQVAIGYIPEGNGSYRDNINLPFTLGSPAGGGYSTVEDLFQFALALNSGKLVSAASRKEMFTDQKERDYGYGFDVRQTPAGLQIGHGGGAPGVNAGLYVFPESGYVVAVMANYDRAAQLVGNYLLSQILAMSTTNPSK